MTIAEQRTPCIAIPMRLADSGAMRSDPRVGVARTIFNAVVDLIRQSAQSRCSSRLVPRRISRGPS